VVLGTLPELSKDGMCVNKLNMVKYTNLQGKRLNTITKVRYNDLGTPAAIEQEEDTMKVFFEQGVHAIAPGQAAVFYEGDDVIGGGWITHAFDQNQYLESTVATKSQFA